MADTYASSLLHTETPGLAWTGVTPDNTRRIYGIGDRVAELSPQQALFFTYLSKVAKQTTDDTIWKPLEYRHQWQRRNLRADYIADDGATSGAGVKFTCTYNNQGKAHDTETYSPIFLVAGQVLRFNGVVWKIAEDTVFEYMTTVGGADNDTISTNGKGTTDGDYAFVPLAKMVKVSDGSTTFATDNSDSGQGQVIGSQWAEGSQAPEGWRDELSDTEFYAQIFKTSVPLMSGSAMATKYRGFPNEWKRIYAEHVMSHKMDIENAMLFGYGKYTNQDSRYSWGMIPFLETKGGKLYTMDYGADDGGATLPFTYDGLVDLMEDFMAPESGNSGQKLVLTSRKVIAKMSKLGTDSFVANSLGSSGTSPFRANLDVKPSKFAPVDVTSIGTSFGSLNFLAHPLFRGDMEDKAVAIDLSNVKYRPLAANGHNRDTFVETNVQDNSTDGRKDQIITEAGLEINLPETHAVISFIA